MSIKKVLELLEGKDYDRVRLILLTQNFIFNSKIRYIKKLAKDQQSEMFHELSVRLKVPSTFIYLYTSENEIWTGDIEYAQNVCFVWEDVNGTKYNIEKEGVYIRFEADKPDKFYKKIISQLRAEDAFNHANFEEQFFSIQAGNYAKQFNKGKKAKTPRHQHGNNHKVDWEIYLTCETVIKAMYMLDTPDEKVFFKHALDEAADRLKKDKGHVKSIYYEVCRRYKLPTLENNPISPHRY